MGTCCSSTSKSETHKHAVLLDYLEGDGYNTVVWGAFKLSTEKYMTYEEFQELLFMALQIFDSVEINASNHLSRQLSTESALTHDEMIELSYSENDKYKQNNDKKSSDIIPPQPKPFDVEPMNINSKTHQKTYSDDMQEKLNNALILEKSITGKLKHSLDVIAPTLALQFDQDGDGAFSWEEFKALCEYLEIEYNTLKNHNHNNTNKHYKPPSHKRTAQNNNNNKSTDSSEHVPLQESY